MESPGSLKLNHKTPRFLSRGGEMGQLIRSRDWTSTPIGSIEQWPQSLCTTLGILLNSKFPMFLFWGPELLCFYNDAYRISLGVDGKHPESLGKPGDEVWPEIWSDIKPLIDRVFEDGEASWHEDQLLPINRNGRLENVYWTYSYSPVYDENDIAGVFVTVSETTKTVETIQKLELSEQRFRNLVRESNVGIIVLHGKEMRVDVVNEMYGSLINCTPDELINNKLFDIIPEAESFFRPILEKVMETGEPLSMIDTPFSVNVKGENINGFLNVVYQPYKELNGTITGVIATCHDVTEAVNSRKIIEKNQLLLSNVIREMPVRITFLSGPDLKIALINQMVLDSWGKDYSVIGTPLKEVLQGEHNQQYLEILNQVYETGRPYSAMESEVWYNDEPNYFDIWYKPIFDAVGNVYGIISSTVEVTDKVLAQQKNIDSEHRLRDVIENAPFPIGVYTGKELRIQLANQTMLDTWGKGNDVVGKLYTEILPELDNQEIFDQLRNVFDTGIPYHAKNTRVDLVIDNKLTPFYFNYSFTPLYDSSGKIYGVMNTAADVSDINIARLKIEQSEQRFRSLIAAAPIAIGVFMGPDFIIGTHNQTFIDIVGKGDDIFGKQLKEVMPELLTEGQPFLKILTDVYETATMFQSYGEMVKIVQNGIMTHNYYDITYTPLIDGDGKVYGILDLAVDVTENVVAQQKIEENERNLRNTIMQAPVAMCILRGRDFIVEIANDRMADLWGKNHDEIIGKALLGSLSELEGQGFELLLKRVYETGETYKAYDVPVNLPRTSGVETVYVDFVYEAFKETDGTISGILAVATDVTEKMIARLKIQQAEESTRLAVESAELGSYQINMKTNEMEASDRFNEIWGVSHTVSRAEYAKRIHPDDWELRKIAHNEAVQTGNLHYETRIVHHDKSVVWARIKGKLLFDDEGKPKMLLGVIQDITEQKQFAEELTRQVKQRTLELNRSNEDLLHFAHVASHDLKEPVRKIKVFSNMLEDQFGELLPEKGRMFLGKVQNATNRMFSMIEGILTYSAVNASDQPIEKIDLNEVVQNIETDLEVLVQQKNAIITFDSLPTIDGASILIYQLFYNLINNSLKFSKTDVDSRILIGSRIVSRDGIDYAEITLTDNGIGLDPEYASKIFNAFTRLNAKDKYEGTGLGLALCQKITDRHRGSISASGTMGEGAVFTVLLPVHQLEKIV
jgi:PAS domain S-box-containing protein